MVLDINLTHSIWKRLNKKMRNISKNSNISFIIPAYNCQDFIAESVESIFNGNFIDGDEVIIVDDASTDNTLKVIKSFQKKYPAIKIFRHHYNKGSAAAGRNTGIDNSRNDLIFCLDADNILCPNSVPKLKEYLLCKGADAAAFGELHYFIENKKVTHKWIFKNEVLLADCLKDNKFPGASGNYLFTKQSWLKAGRYNESIGGANDSWAFGFCQLVTGSKMVTMPNSFYYHRHGYESTYVKEIKKNNSSLTVLQIVLPYIDLLDERDIDYIMGKKGRHTWFNNLEKHPIKIKNISLTKSNKNLSKSFFKVFKKLL